MTQNFYPEPGAPTNRTLALARGMALAGHDVTVICEFPCYPTGILEKKDRCKIFRKERFENIKIVRTFVIPTSRSNLFSRLSNYFSYMISSFLIALFLKKPDLIIASSPPLFVGPSAVALSKLKKVPLVADIRDLWPEDAVEIGQLKNPMAIWAGRSTSNSLYQNAVFITTISNGFKDHIQNITGKNNVYILYNGSSVPELNFQISSPHPDIDSKFIVCYSGTIGLGQPVEDIISVADKTREFDDIEYWIIGEGVRRAALENMALNLNLANIKFFGGVAFIESLVLMSKTHAAIVALYNRKYYKSAIPSKFFDCMALGLPVILGVDGEARKIMEDNNTGLFYESGNIDDLKSKILMLKNKPEMRIQLGSNGKMLVGSKFKRLQLVRQLNSLITEYFESKN